MRYGRALEPSIDARGLSVCLLFLCLPFLCPDEAGQPSSKALGARLRQERS